MSETTPPVFRYIETDLPRVEPPVYVPARRHRYWLHALLFVLTLVTTMMVGTRLELNFLQSRPVFTLGDDFIPLFPVTLILHHPTSIFLGLPFSLTLMAILLSHEMGHYIFCIRYGVYATLPYFIPAPTLIGTMGAFIRIKSPIRSRTALFDIGIAGPIAGFMVASVVMLAGLMLSKTGAPPIGSGDVVMGFPLVFKLAHWLIMGSGVQALSLENMLIHPIAIAAWVGMFATALNLLPGGQLDGGHIIYALMPRAHRYVSILTIGILIPMARVWPGWGLWAVLLFISGLRHPNVPPWPELSPFRRFLGAVALMMLIITITPAGLNIAK